jgi:hypothetical protein
MKIHYTIDLLKKPKTPKVATEPTVDWKAIINDKKLSKEEKLKIVKLQVKPLEEKAIKKLTEIEQTIPESIKKSM